MALFLSLGLLLRCTAVVLALARPPPAHLMLPLLLLLGGGRELGRVAVELPRVVAVDHVLVLHHCCLSLLSAAEFSSD